MACEKGTYVRSLARDLAEALGTRGHVTALRRTAVGGFSEKNTVSIEAIETSDDRDALLTPVEVPRCSICPNCAMTPEDAAFLRNAGVVLLRGRCMPRSQLAEAWASLQRPPPWR